MQSTMEKQIQVVKVIWIALMLAMVAVTAIPFLMASPVDPSGSRFIADGATRQQQMLLELVFNLSGIVLFLLAFLLTKPLARAFAKAQKPPTLALIIRMALLDAGVNLGLMLAMLTKNPAKIVPFFAMGALGMVLAYPTPGFFAKLLGLPTANAIPRGGSEIPR